MTEEDLDPAHTPDDEDDEAAFGDDECFDRVRHLDAEVEAGVRADVSRSFRRNAPSGAAQIVLEHNVMVATTDTAKAMFDALAEVGECAAFEATTPAGSMKATMRFDLVKGVGDQAGILVIEGSMQSIVQVSVRMEVAIARVSNLVHGVFQLEFGDGRGLDRATLEAALGVAVSRTT